MSKFALETLFVNQVMFATFQDRQLSEKYLEKKVKRKGWSQSRVPEDKSANAIKTSFR